MSQNSKIKSSSKAWFILCLICCGIVILTSTAGFLLSRYLLYPQPKNSETQVKHHVSLSVKSQSNNQYQETFTDPFRLSRITFSVTKDQLNQYPVHTKGTLIYRNNRLILFQPDTRSRQDTQNLKQEIQKLQTLSP